MEILEHNPDFTVATHDHALIVHFRGRTPLECAAALRRGAAKLGDKAVFFAVIETTSVPPDTPTRNAFSAFFDENSERLAGVVIAVRGDGFRTAMVRAIIAGIFLVSSRFRAVAKKHIVTSPEDGAKHAEAARPGLDGGALLAAFRALTERQAA